MNKSDFPILERKINGLPLVYLDNAATSQKPQVVLDAIVDYYKNHNANVHRGVHTLADEATDLYESARKKVADFIGAKTPKEIIFTKNSSESLNMIAWSWGLQNLTKDDEVLILESEHNSSMLPWRAVAEKVGAKIVYLDLNEQGGLDLAEVKAKVTTKTKAMVIAHASNVLGTIFPIKEIAELTKSFGVLLVVDGAQAVPHMKVNVSSLGCDFYAFSGHKMVGPMGIGVLWGRSALLEEMKPMELGGGAILTADRYDYKLLDSPEKFEAGTPNVEGAVGLAAAIDYLQKIGMDTIKKYEEVLNGYTLSQLFTIPGLKILGPLDPRERTGLVSFVIDGLHPHDIASILNSCGVAVRSGTHCAMVLHKKYSITSSTRASYYFYNDTTDIDKLVEGIRLAIKTLSI